MQPGINGQSKISTQPTIKENEMKLYYMTMWRFGNDYNIITDDMTTGRSALKAKYIELYEIYNGTKPTKEEVEKMLSDIEVTIMKINEVFDPCSND